MAFMNSGCGFKWIKQTDQWMLTNVNIKAKVSHNRSIEMKRIFHYKLKCKQTENTQLLSLNRWMEITISFSFQNNHHSLSNNMTIAIVVEHSWHLFRYFFSFLFVVFFFFVFILMNAHHLDVEWWFVAIFRAPNTEYLHRWWKHYSRFVHELLELAYCVFVM